MDEFVDIVHHAGLAHDVQTDDRTGEGSHGETVGLGVSVYLIGRRAAAAAFDNFKNESRIPRNIFG